MRRFLSIVFAFILLQIAHTSCPTGFELAIDGQCNKFYGSITTDYHQGVNAATSKCVELHAQLIIIHNNEQQSYWTSKRNGIIIIGLVCNTKTSKWEWSDGSTMDYKSPSYNADLNGNCKSGCTWYIGNDGGYWTYYCGSDVSPTFDIYCTTQLPTLPVPSADGCESFEDDSDDGICYQVGAAAENWQEAQMICRSFGSEVASIHNLQENLFIRRFAVSKAQVTGLYIGATVSGKGNSFAWIDGSDWEYDNFYPGFPINGLGDCLLMDTESAAGQWVNVDCSSKQSVACMRQQNYAAPECSAGPWVEGQIIYSPGFPFDSSTPCDFILSVDAGKKVEVEILLLEANSCCDELVLFENYFGGTVVANLTGEVNDKKYKTSSSNFMRVSWRPNGGVNVRGMMMTFRGV